VKKTFKILGLIFGLSIVYSIIFYIAVDKSVPFYNDMGVLEALIFILAMFVGAILDVLLISLIAYSILFYLKKRKVINLDSNVLFVSGYSITVIILLFLYLWFISKNVADFNLESITRILFIPLLHSIIGFNVVEYFFKKKKK
tara:strand:- start:45 stop:473 length:429 start_codon:yes stop_codon:yes gene_type:complete